MSASWLLLVLPGVFLAASQAGAAVVVYPFTFDPKENPDFMRYPVRPHPSLDVFKPQPQFQALRYFHSPGSHIIDYKELIELYLLNPNTTLGGILSPAPAFLFADNFKEFVDYVQQQGLYITSVHGFSPTGAGFRPPRDSLDYLELKLGSGWFGMANGEQDGHYMNGFVPAELPLNSDARDQYINFRDYFRELETILGPRMTTLLSSTYPHYQLKSGLYTIAGAETSQHGPNSQLRYAFIRGAGKQYGVLWYGDVSVFSPFGHKEYITPAMVTWSDATPKKPRETEHERQTERSYKCVNTTDPLSDDPEKSPVGPTCGTSLNLMKRLMYSHMMYNSGYASFEGGWFYREKNDTLSPIGLIQHNAYLWTKQRNGNLGVHTPTLGLLLDFFGGWAAPRFKGGVVYRTWTNLPYSEGDYYTDNVLRMIYTSYQDAPYFHDEHAVSTVTPYGDFVDVLLSDAPEWILSTYNTIVVASELRGGLEVQHNLMSFVQGGGNLVLTAGNLAKLPGGLLGVSTKLECRAVEAGADIILQGGGMSKETFDMSVCDLQHPKNSTIPAKLANFTPLAVRVTLASSGGSVTVFATPFAISSSPVCKPSSEIDKSLCTPYPLLDHVGHVLDPIFKTAAVFYTFTNVSFIPAVLDADVFNVLVTNPSLSQQPLNLQSQHGSIVSMSEIKLDESEKGHIGYLPDGFEGTDIGKSTNTTIAGGDTRLFRVQLSAGSTKFKPKMQPKARPQGVALHIRHIDHSIRHEILYRPTFFQHFDSVVVDFSYLITKDSVFLKEESQWLKQQGVTVYVDASSSINLFPTLRLTDDAPDLFNKSILELTSLIHKMYGLGSQNLVISLHKSPTGQSENKTLMEFNTTIHYLVHLASQLNITVHMLDTPKNQFNVRQLLRWMESSNLAGVKLVLNLAQIISGDALNYDTEITYNSSMLYINAPGWQYGRSYANNIPVSQTNATIQSALTSKLNHICDLRECPYRKPYQHFLPTSDWHHNYRTLQHASDEKKSGRVPRRPFYPMVLDGVYENYDTEFADVNFLEGILVEKE